MQLESSSCFNQIWILGHLLINQMTNWSSLIWIWLLLSAFAVVCCGGPHSCHACGMQPCPWASLYRVVCRTRKSRGEEKEVLRKEILFIQKTRYQLIVRRKEMEQSLPKRVIFWATPSERSLQLNATQNNKPLESNYFCYLCSISGFFFLPDYRLFTMSYLT